MNLKELRKTYNESKKLERAVLKCFSEIIKEDKKDEVSLLKKLDIDVEYEDLLNDEGKLITENITSIYIPKGGKVLNFDIESITQFIPIKYIVNPKMIKQDLLQFRNNIKVELPKERPAELELSIADKIAWVRGEIKKLEDAGINTYEDTVSIAMFRGYLKCLETTEG